MRVLVTGGAGFIGRHLVALIDSLGHECRVVDDGSTGRFEELPPSTLATVADIAQISLDKWAHLLDGIDVVFHLAARKYRSPNVTPEMLVDTNIRATEILARACVRAGVKRIVFTSSLYAYGSMGPERMSEHDSPRPSTLYGLSKLAGEHIISIAGQGTALEWNTARLFFTYGPRQYTEGGYKSVVITNFEKMLAGLPPTVRGSGVQQLDYTYVEDMARALWELGTADPTGHIVNVCSGGGISVNLLTERMMAIAGFVGIPDDLPPDETQGSIRIGDPSRMAEIFGWHASTPLSDGLGRTWRSMRGISEGARQG